MSKRKKKSKRKATTPKPPRLNDGDRIIQAAVQSLSANKTTH